MACSCNFKSKKNIFFQVNYNNSFRYFYNTANYLVFRKITYCIKQKKVYCIPSNTSLPIIDRPVGNPCVHFLNKKCTNDSCKFDHVSYCLNFYNYGICNDTDCRDFHPQELIKLVQNGVKTGEGFYYRWKDLYRAQICRAKYKDYCKQDKCQRFHLKSTR